MSERFVKPVRKLLLVLSSLALSMPVLAEHATKPVLTLASAKQAMRSSIEF